MEASLDQLQVTLNPLSPSTMDRDISASMSLSEPARDAFLDRLKHAALSWMTAGIIRDAKMQAKLAPYHPDNPQRVAFEHARVSTISAFYLLWPKAADSAEARRSVIIDIPSSPAKQKQVSA